MKNRWWRYLTAAAAVVVVCLIAVAALVARRTPEQTSQVPRIHIGAILPLTGKAAVLGNDWRSGAIVAMEEFNQKSDLKSNLCVIDFQDSKGEAPTALTIARRQHDLENIRFFITGVTPVALTLAPVMDENNCIQVTFAMTETIARNSRLTVRVYPGMQEEAQIFIDALKKMRPSRVAAITHNAEAWKGLVDNFLIPAAKAQGVEAFTYETFDAVDTASLRALFAKVAAQQPQVLFLAAYAFHMPALITAAQESDFRAKTHCRIVSSFELATAYLQGNIQIQNLNDVIVAVPDYLLSVSAGTNQLRDGFYSRFKTRWNAVPSYDAAYAYDALRILLTGIEASNADPRSVAAFIKRMKTYDGVSGVSGFADDGNSISIWKTAHFSPNGIAQIQPDSALLKPLQ